MKTFYVRKNEHEVGPFNIRMASIVASICDGEVFSKIEFEQQQNEEELE
jgi:hypothetical protein